MPTAQPSRILKSHTAGRQQTALFNLNDWQREAETIVENARQTAELIIAEAKKQAEQIRQAASEAGQRTGYEQGMARAEQEIEARAAQEAEQVLSARVAALIPPLEELIGKIEAHREEWRLAWEADAVSLSVAIAEKIVRRTIDANPDAIREVVRPTLELASGKPVLTVRIAAETVEHLGTAAADFVQTVSRAAEINLVGDETLVPGDCIIETTSGSIDGRLATQLERIAEELLPASQTGAG